MGNRASRIFARAIAKLSRSWDRPACTCKSGQGFAMRDTYLITYMHTHRHQLQRGIAVGEAVPQPKKDCSGLIYT